MFSRQEHHTEDQVICWNCEEAVHQSAIVCPYCNVDVHRHQVQQASKQDKIAAFPQVKLPKTSETSEGALQTVSFAVSLLLLLAGSTSFIVAVVIAFFSRDGAFTISWREHTWSAFFGLGLSLLAGGAFFMHKVSDSTDEA